MSTKMLPSPKTSTPPGMPKGLLDDLRRLIDQTRQSIASVVNSGLAMLYWRVGMRVSKEILKGERAEYGRKIVATLSKQLVLDYGKSFSDKNLRRMVQFAEVFPEEQIVVSLIRQLSWTHFIALIPIQDPMKRDFYAEMCRIEGWNVKTLRAKIDSMLYEGQMELYLRWLDKHERRASEEAPMGLSSLQWAQTATIKTTLIQALHWHCKELNPPVPQSQHKSSNYTPQQQTAWEYNRVLQENGYDKLFAQNQTAIPNDFAHIFLMGRATTISLKNPISQVVADFTASKREILNKGDQNA